MKIFAPKWLNSSVNNYLVFGFRIIIGAIFILAGLSKTVAPIAEFIGMAKQWNILPDPWVTIYATALPWVELVAGIFLVVGAWHRWSSGLILLMLISFVIAIIINLARGTELENCGCFGGWIDLGESFKEVLWRDIAMLVVTIWIMFTPAPLWFSVDQWLAKGTKSS